MIQVCDFSKAYKSSFKISGINFSVEPGKITALVGANGSGKSTIIKAICGFHYADGGEILLSGEGENSFSCSSTDEKAMELTGYVPEVSNLPQELFVSDFLKYAAKTHGIYGQAMEAAVQKVIESCQLKDVLTKKIKTLSKGYKQRVSLAQALIYNPANLVLDEPVTGLDPVQIADLRKLLRKLSATKSILISTHILSEVKELCEKVIVIKEGRQIAFGSEEEILSSKGVKSLEELI